MKILFIEDTDVFITRFKKQLEEIGEVTHFTGSNAARRAMGREAEDFKFDLIVCDHYINRFEEDHQGYTATGDEIYMHLRFMLEIENIPFIHFSSEPCPDKYEDSKDNKYFHTLCKSYDSQLIPLVKEVMGVEDDQ